MNQDQGVIVSVFLDQNEARSAVSELADRGFAAHQLGMASCDRCGAEGQDETYASEGAVAGVTAGAGVGALWGIGIISGVLPVLGPAIAAGTLAAILSSAAAGATVAGLAGTLIGLGISRDDAEYYESEFEAGRTLVTVTAPGREVEARDVMARHGGFERTEAQAIADARRA